MSGIGVLNAKAVNQMSDIISRAGLFNRLAGIKSPPEANEYKAEVFSVIQSMPAEDDFDNGCEGCKYTSKDQYEMPCLVCRNSHMNMWTKGEDDG